ncbi:MAG: phosphoglycerate kinase, partial [Nitrososphaerota archaeon]
MRPLGIKTLDDLDANDKRILVRCDFNSPIDPNTKHIVDDTRIRIHADTTIR